MSERKKERIFGLKDVTIIDEGKEYKAIITDISETGIALKADISLFTYKEVAIRFKINEEEINLRASVRYVQDFARSPRLKLKSIGVALIDPDQRYIDYVHSLKS